MPTLKRERISAQLRISHLYTNQIFILNLKITKHMFVLHIGKRISINWSEMNLVTIQKCL